MPNFIGPRLPHEATWILSLAHGFRATITIPLPIASADAEDIEELFTLILRRVRRETAEPNPEAADA